MDRETTLLDVENLPAGGFSDWLRTTHDAQLGSGGVDVPCGACNACCKSSYFIHIAPEETRTLRRIPKQLLFAAPGLPAGNKVMGYDKNGHCPMLVDEKCSIYEDRPQTCRTYDCRVFPAAEIDGGNGRADLNAQIRRWKFSYPTPHDYEDHAAVRAAAAFLREHADSFPAGTLPSNATQLAVLAIIVYDVFAIGSNNQSRSIPEIAAAVVDKKKAFDAARPR